MTEPTTSTGTRHNFEPSSVVEGAILTGVDPANPHSEIRCHVDRLDDNGNVYLTVLDGKTYNAKRDFNIPMSTLTNQQESWRLLKKAA
jgi:hypothetical protein